MKAEFSHGRPRNVLGRAYLAVTLCFACSLVGFTEALGANDLVPGPGGAISAVALANHRLAVLAGSNNAKSVSVIDLDGGQVLQSFGVTRESTGIGTQTPEGPLLVTVARGMSGGRFGGSVERWSLEGKKLRVVPMPTGALGITQVLNGRLFVLVGDDRTRAAISLDASSLARGKSIPLDADAASLAFCPLGPGGDVVYAGTDSAVSLVETVSGRIHRSSIVAESPACINGERRIYAISKGRSSRSLVVLSVLDMRRIASLPASRDARAIYPIEDSLLVLNVTSQVSDVQGFSHDELSALTAAKATSVQHHK